MDAGEQAHATVGDGFLAVHVMAGTLDFESSQMLDVLLIENGATVTVSLSFASPHAQHLIGRPRISLSDIDDAARDLALPPEVRQDLAITADKRNDAQRIIRLQDGYATKERVFVIDMGCLIAGAAN